MSKGSNLVLLAKNEPVSIETINNTCNKVKDYLNLKWVMSIWCRKITVSIIVKVGNESDAELLSDAQVKHHKKNQSRKSCTGNSLRKKKSLLFNKESVNSNN